MTGFVVKGGLGKGRNTFRQYISSLSPTPVPNVNHSQHETLLSLARQGIVYAQYRLAKFHFDSYANLLRHGACKYYPRSTVILSVCYATLSLLFRLQPFAV